LPGSLTLSMEPLFSAPFIGERRWTVNLILGSMHHLFMNMVSFIP
jgi:hypothetical protein